MSVEEPLDFHQVVELLILDRSILDLERSIAALWLQVAEHDLLAWFRDARSDRLPEIPKGEILPLRIDLELKPAAFSFETRKHRCMTCWPGLDQPGRFRPECRLLDRGYRLPRVS
jgi:hypothetical protein